MLPKIDCRVEREGMIKFIEIVEDRTETYMDGGLPHARIDEDIIQMGHTLDETRSNSLKALAFLYTEFGGYEHPLDEYKKKMKKSGASVDNYLTIPESILREYAVMDAIVTLRVYRNLLAHMRELDEKYPNEFFPGNTMEHYYRTYRIPAANMYADIEYQGVYVDKAQLDKARGILQDELKKTEQELAQRFHTGPTFNFQSDGQVAELLEKAGWECHGRGKSNQYLVGKGPQKLWAKEGHEEAKLFLKLGSLNTLMGTFTGYGFRDQSTDSGWAACLRKHDDGSVRMHPTFSCMQTDSGRSRCGNPNMQQVPTRGKFAADIKKAIHTPNDDEFYLCTIDYSSLQLRLCCIDEDERDNMYDAFQDLGVDIHSATGYNTFVKGKEMDVEIVTVEQDGKTYEFLGGESVITVNRGEVHANELLETDTLKV